MTGLDIAILDNFQHEQAIRHIISDLRTDFILAPHLRPLYSHGDRLWEELRSQLRSGTFEASLPILVEVPKPSGLTRPGALLLPLDRLLYQCLVDSISSSVEDALDRDAVFSNVVLTPDPEGRMFQDTDEWYSRYQSRTIELADEYPVAVKADITCFFETIYQHILINSLRSLGVRNEISKTLADILLAWRERNSHGILQGMFPSDVLGNFYLLSSDYQFNIREVPYLRFVDDYHLFFTDEQHARRELADFCGRLRAEGLYLNERKTRILPASDLVHETTEFDRLIEEVAESLREDDVTSLPYGFEPEWDWEGDEEEPIEADLESSVQAVKSLYQRQDEAEFQQDRVIRFALPQLARLHSDCAIDDSIVGIRSKPHLAFAYCSYLATVALNDRDVTASVENLLMAEDELLYEWQRHWVVACLMRRERVSTRCVNWCVRRLQQHAFTDPTRALFALLIGGKGNVSQRRALRLHYSNETSDYVRSAIVYAAQNFPGDERRTCWKAWGGHSLLNSLVIAAVRAGQQ